MAQVTYRKKRWFGFVVAEELEFIKAGKHSSTAGMTAGAGSRDHTFYCKPEEAKVNWKWYETLSSHSLSPGDVFPPVRLHFCIKSPNSLAT